MSTEDITTAYTEALGKTKFVGMTGFEGATAVYSDLTYDMLTGTNSPLAGDYCLTDSSNNVVVTNDLKQKFEASPTLHEFLVANSTPGYTLASPAVPEIPTIPAVPYTPYTPASPATPAIPATSATYPAGFIQASYESQIAVFDADVVTARNVFNNTPPLVTVTKGSLMPSAYADWQNAQATVTSEQAYHDHVVMAGNPTQERINQSLALITSYQASATARRETYNMLAADPNGTITQANPAYAAAGNALNAAISTRAAFGTTTPGTIMIPGSPEIPAKPATPEVLMILGSPEIPGTPGIPAVPGQTGPKTNESAYYTNMFNRMKEGFTTVADEANTVNSKEWLTQQLKNGGLYLEKFGIDGKTKDQNIASASEISEVRDDKDLDILTAKYNADLQKIQIKDKRLDMEIKQLDTEHSALQTEVESVQKVITKNIESSFKTFG